METVLVQLAVDVAEETAEAICGTPMSWDTLKGVLYDAEPGILVLGEVHTIETDA